MRIEAFRLRIDDGDLAPLFGRGTSLRGGGIAAVVAPVVVVVIAAGSGEDRGQGNDREHPEQESQLRWKHWEWSLLYGFPPENSSTDRSKSTRFTWQLCKRQAFLNCPE